MHPRVTSEALRSATADEMDLYEALVKIKTKHKALSSQKNELENKLRQAIGDDVGIEGVATWKGSKDRARPLQEVHHHIDWTTHTTNHRREEMTTAMTHGSNLKTLQGYLEKKKDVLVRIAPKGSDVDRIMRIALFEAAKNEKLANCSPVSVYLALAKACELDLVAGGVLHRCALVPRWNKGKKTFEADLMIEYTGLMDLVRRSGEVKNFTAPQDGLRRLRVQGWLQAGGSHAEGPSRRSQAMLSVLRAGPVGRAHRRDVA